MENHDSSTSVGTSNSPEPTTGQVNQEQVSNSTEAAQPVQQTFWNKLTIILLGLIFILAGGTFYFWQRYQQATSFPLAELATPVTEMTTVNLQTYSEGGRISFQYPATWIKSGPNILESSNPPLKIAIIEEGDFIGECMQEISTETRNGFTIKNFETVEAGEMCTNGDNLSQMQTWIVESEDFYGSGLIVYYDVQDQVEVEEALEKILATYSVKNL